MFLGTPGTAIRRLMRCHKVTIAALAQRMDISQARVRQVRQRGLSDPAYVRDWIEAITGRDPGPL